MQRNKKIQRDDSLSQRKVFPWKLAVLLLLSLATMIVYGNRKVGYHVDEIYSYGLANSEYLPFMHFGNIEYGVKDWMLDYGAGESLEDLFFNLVKDFQILEECGFRLKESAIYKDYVLAQKNSSDTRSTSWVSGQAYQDYIAVNESNTFNYASVYYNQRGDVHPPLYYIILHTICSVFQGTFSKWFALSINIAALLFTLMVLYKMVKEYLGGETLALVTVGVYGLSRGFMNTAVFLRMYALLTLLVVLSCYIHLRIAGQDFQLDKKNRRYLMWAVICGFLTHYYYVLYAMGLAAVFIVWMLVRKKWREAVRYFLTLAESSVIGLCIWPYAVRHVFRGYQGIHALDVITQGDFYFIKIRLMFDQVMNTFYGGKRWILWLCLAALAGIVLWETAGRKNAHSLKLACRRLPIGKGALVTVPVVLYVIVVAQIAPMLIERYVMCTFPFWILFVTSSAGLVLRKLTAAKPALNRWRNILLIVTGCFLFSLNNGYRIEPDGLYNGGQGLVILPENTDCIYVLPNGDWNESAIDSTILAQCRQVGLAYEEDLELLSQKYQYGEGDYVLVAIQKDMEIEAVLEQVKDLFGLTDLHKVEEREGSTAVRILLTR